MSEVKQGDWVVEFDIDYPARKFHVKRVTVVDKTKNVARLFEPYLWVTASDELGAFSQGSNAMRHLGFTPARDA